jgi:hypothetical protein
MTAEEVNMMIQEITLGIPKSESLVLHTPADSDMWDRLSVEIANIKARGHEIDLPF